MQKFRTSRAKNDSAINRILMEAEKEETASMEAQAQAFADRLEGMVSLMRNGQGLSSRDTETLKEIQLFLAEMGQGEGEQATTESFLGAISGAGTTHVDVSRMRSPKAERGKIKESARPQPASRQVGATSSASFLQSILE